MSFNRQALAWALGLTMLLALVPGVMAQEVTVQVSDHPELGKILTDGKGMTLYLYTPDKENVSNCYDQCAVNWPPLLVGEGLEPVAGEGLTGKLGVTDRTDGGRQVTYNGMPLYYWIKDSQPGDVTGQGVGNVWFVVHPDISSMTVDSPVVQTMELPELGNILTNQGMTLYMYTKDAEGVSNCYDQCAVNWPPLLVGESDAQVGEGLEGGLTVIDRDDGTRQVAYNGMPLYFWIKDVRPGDATGENVGGVWFVINPGETFASFPAAPAAQESAQATPQPAAAEGDAAQEQPSSLPETGGESVPWVALALVVGGAAVLAGTAGLSRARRPR
jgi:predicted lipoprotein with Yx(FWY)xxD motif